MRLIGCAPYMLSFIALEAISFFFFAQSIHGLRCTYLFVDLANLLESPWRFSDPCRRSSSARDALMARWRKENGYM
jgi:hypothetical protein